MIKQEQGKSDSFFKDEVLLRELFKWFYFFNFGLFISIFKDKKKHFLFIIIFLFFNCNFITGERSNSIKAIFGMVFFYQLIDFIKLK